MNSFAARSVSLCLLLLMVLAAAGCSGTKADTTPPEAPLSLLATRGNSRVTLTWTAVTSDDLKGYYAYYSQQDGGSEIKSDLVTRTSIVITGLENGTTYIFYVTALDEAGNESPPSPEVTATPNNEQSLTAQGWSAWELGDYETAQSLFNDALNFDVNYADAFNGLGWTALRQGELQTAVNRFETAISKGLVTQDARVGALAVFRDLPGQLPKAMNYGVSVLENDPQYEFSHDPTINVDVVRLMLAQVFFRLGESFFSYAQEQMDVLVPGNGLDPANPSTWSVQAATYPNYPAALLALIQYAFSLLPS